jgi:hypothetical protein
MYASLIIIHGNCKEATNRCALQTMKIALGRWPLTITSITLYLIMNLAHLMEYIQTLPSVIKNNVREINTYSYILHHSSSCSNNNSNCKYDSIVKTISFVMG